MQKAGPHPFQGCKFVICFTQGCASLTLGYSPIPLSGVFRKTVTKTVTVTGGASMVKQLVRTGIGQDSHRFLTPDSTKPCIIAGVVFDKVPGFNANSDGDVVFHAICNAISSLTGILILGDIADDLCLKDGITDSEVYLVEAMKTLGKQTVTHVAVTLEAKKPKFKTKLLEMRSSIARVMDLDISQVGMTATTGEGLTDFGCGDGVQAFAIVTTEEMI
jgi:2-C-methyl-D-erythritol 2,4-cyclodiphosphate synthase